MDDLQSVIEFIGNGMSKNISLYCKGESSSLVGLWFNVYFPYLFNATVLHVTIVRCRMDCMSWNSGKMRNYGSSSGMLRKAVAGRLSTYTSIGSNSRR